MTASTITAHPLLDAARLRLDDHLRHLGPIPWVRPLVLELEAAGLTGRGGGGFPVACKLAAAASAATSGGRTPLVVANGAEGEPASAKDRQLLTHAPHLVLDGLQLAAAAIGADRAHVLVAPAALVPVQVAVLERGGIDRVPVEVTVAAERFVAGEESAVVAALEGRPAK